jgi:ribosomal protein S1
VEGYGGFIHNDQITEKKDKELDEIYSQGEISMIPILSVRSECISDICTDKVRFPEVN